MNEVVLFLPSVSLLAETTLADRHREFPRLAWCLSNGVRTAHEGPLEPLLMALCGLDPRTSLAALTAQHDLALIPAASELLRCDPVYLHADPNKVLAYGAASLNLTALEAEELIATINREFPELACRRADCPERWYIQRPPDVSGVAPSVQWLHGRSLSPFMPVAATERSWRRWLNDLQMLLHEHPVNQARNEQGHVPINGVWWFGAGELPHAQVKKSKSLMGNDVLLAGIARTAGCDWQAYARIDDVMLHKHNAVVIAGSAFGAANKDAAISIEEIDTDWLPKLIRALKLGQLKQLTIMAATHRIELGFRHGWQWWRKPQPFAIDT